MSTTLILVAAVVVAFVGGRAISHAVSRLQLLSGVEYLLLGVVLGPYGANALSHDVLAALDLFVSFVLGVMGFVVGLGLRRIRGGLEVGLAGATTSLIIVALVGGGAVAAVQALDPTLLSVEDPVAALPLASDGQCLLSLWIAPYALWIGLTIGAAAGVSSVALIELAARRYAVRGSRLPLLESLAVAGEVAAVLAFGIAMAGARATSEAHALGLTLTEWGVITVGAGAACGVLFTVFIGREDNSMRILVATIGAVTFSAGIGAALGVSPLFVNLIAGALVGISSPYAARLGEATAPLRFPTRVLVLLIAGAIWSPVSGWAWVLPLGYAIVRALVLRVAAPMSAWTFLPGTNAAIRLGMGLFGQGALAAAIAISFAQRFPELSSLVTTTVLGGMMLTDLFSARVLRRYLADQGAIRPHQTAAESADAASIRAPEAAG
jgi:Kef-type K+ transport system membrane component KefB